METKFALPGFKKFITSECPFAGCGKQNLFTLDDGMPIRVCEHFSHVQKESITARDIVVSHIYTKPGAKKIADSGIATAMALAAAVHMVEHERDELKKSVASLEKYSATQRNEKLRYKKLLDIARKEIKKGE